MELNSNGLDFGIQGLKEINFLAAAKTISQEKHVSLAYLEKKLIWNFS
jgi:hypothetical protein